MKKILCILIMIIVSICIMAVGSYANISYNVEQKKYTYTGKDVTIKLNNKQIKTDIPPIIHNDRTLIPIRALVEELGGSVGWNSEESKVTIKLDDNTIIMNIDSNIATVNNKKTTLDVSPCIAYEGNDTGTGRTVVPIRFVMENLGLEVDWNQDTYTVLVRKKEKNEEKEEQQEENKIYNSITNMQYNVTDDKIIVKITTEEEMEYSIMNLKDNYRTVVDVKKSNFSCSTKTMNIDIGNIDKIRTGQTEDYARIVIDLYDKEEYEIFLNNSKNILTIEYNYTKKQISDVQVDISNSNKSIINIDGTNINKYDIRRLTNPERIELTIYDISIKNESAIFNKEILDEYISKIESRNESGNTKIIAYLNDQYQYSFSKTSNKSVIEIFDSGLNNIGYNNNNQYVFDIMLDKNMDIDDISYNHDRASNVFTLKIPLSYASLGKGSFKVGDRYVESLNITKDSKEYTITIKGYTACDFIVNTNKKSLTIEIDKRDISRGIIIVVDPGHVGKGSVGASYGGIIERTINTSVGTKLIEMLKELDNVEVYTTLGTNYETLYEATGYANNMGADLFISIHCNAAVSATGDPLENVTGTETYYALKEGDSNYGITSQKLAQFVQDSLLKELGSNNRGVIRRDTLAVLRTSNMPAMLTELGFMSSTKELEKLKDEQYQEKCAKAIYNGIVDAIKYMKK